MSSHNIPLCVHLFKKNHHKLFFICSYGAFSKGLKNEFEIAVVSEASVLEPMKFYCI